MANACQMRPFSKGLIFKFGEIASFVYVCCIPDACCIYERTVSSEIQAAWISNFNDAVYLCVMEIDTPVLQVFSIPKLDSLFEYCLQLNKDEFSGLISQRLICSNFGMVCCLLNPFEICKWSLSVDISTKVHTMYGHLLQTDNNRKQIKSAIGSTSGRQRLGTPNSDSTGFFFFKIFSSNESFDEQSLFEKSGRSDEPHGVFVKSDSNLFDTSSPINRTTSAINSANSEVSQMLRAGEERGMRLNQLDQATARMAEGAREFQHRAKQLSQMHKHRSEKWWQLWK
ncbi:hypothetical protein GJ496_000631 [Pomphorhynchus laevis]|nr:hypothetical protein GJ496_000631 [Pomphorhynchus laevis]